MQTEVVMSRELFGSTISQRSKSEFFSATDLVRAGDKIRAQNGISRFDMSAWFQQAGTKEFIAELEKQFGEVKISGRGRGSHTWVHPMLFIDMALAIYPALKVEVYKWLYDELLKYRNDSGDSYKKMCGALFEHSNRKDLFQRNIQQLGVRIKGICKVDDWQHATQEQLKLRDKIHNNIYLIATVLRDNNQAIEYGINEALKS
jgi:hypothetical protein